MSLRERIKNIIKSTIDDIEKKTKELEKISENTRCQIIQARKEIQAEYDRFIQNKRDYIETLELREKQAHRIIEENRVLHLSAEMYADINKYIFEDAENYLRYKPHPSTKSADVVSEMKKEVRKHIALYREWQYKIEILKNTFPEISRYIEDDTNASILELACYECYDSLTQRYDRRREYISEHEWQLLSESQKSQISLDRYNKREKSNWVVGVEYEMYVEHLLRSDGYNTIPYGSIKKLSDLGRDIIATKIINGELHAYIIQCKRYGAGKEIHENTICQLYGTAIEFELSNERVYSKVHPTLYTTAPLSDMAKKFAQKLNINVCILPMGTYPQIKCNIGSNGEKIYHLPFDQQYYNTIIDKDGEFYAWNVEEATRAGFRRAKKYYEC